MNCATRMLIFGYKCNNVTVHKKQNFRLKNVWVKTHTTLDEKMQMTHQKQHIAVVNQTADELAKGCVSPDGSESAEQVTKGTDKRVTRKLMQ